jgi:hypothetical protein
MSNDNKDATQPDHWLEHFLGKVVDVQLDVFYIAGYDKETRQPIGGELLTGILGLCRDDDNKKKFCLVIATQEENSFVIFSPERIVYVTRHEKRSNLVVP